MTGNDRTTTREAAGSTDHPAAPQQGFSFRDFKAALCTSEQRIYGLAGAGNRLTEMNSKGKRNILDSDT
jgi:hypothetical protein